MTNIEIDDYVKLIYYTMKKFPNYKSKDDLYQAGWVGLMKASSNYDSSFDTKFSTYAYFYIEGEMKKLIEKDHTIKVSKELTKLKLKIEKARILLTQKLMKEPSSKELSIELGVSEELIEEALNSSLPVASLNYALENDSKELLLEDIIPAKNQNIDDLLTLKNAINNLTEEEKRLLAYNMVKNQTEIGELMNMSQVKVSRKITKIKTKILKQVA